MKLGSGKTMAQKVSKAFSLNSTSVELIKRLAQKKRISQARVIEIALEQYGEEMISKRSPHQSVGARIVPRRQNVSAPNGI